MADVSAEAADLVVKEAMQVTEGAIKLAGVGLKNVAAFLIAISNQNNKVVGKTTAKRLARDPAPAEIMQLKKEDMVLLPGGGAGVEHLGKDARVEALVRAGADMGCWLAAICAAPTLLAHLGLLEGRKAVCYPGMEAELTGAEVVDADVVVDGNLITARAAGSAYEFAFTLAALLASPEKSEEVRHGIHYRP